MREGAYILGVKNFRDGPKKLLVLSQEPYIDKILEHFNIYNSKLMNTPIAHNYKISKAICPHTPEENEEIQNVSYLSAIESLMDAMLCTRPNISQTVGLLARYSSDPGKQHWQCIKRVFRYLKGTKDYWLCY